MGGIKSTGGFRYQFGSGAPGAGVGRNAPYIDLTANNTLYVYNAGAWHSAGTLGAFDATSLQGVAMNAGAPSDQQVLTYNGTDWKGA